MLGIVQTEALKRHPRHVVALQRGEELEGVPLDLLPGGVDVEGEAHVGQVDVDMVVRVRAHCDD